jgi:YD repeat-containing protein
MPRANNFRRAANGGVTTYGYNAAGELTGVTNPSGQVESYTYNSGGQELTRIEPDGSVTQYSYNAAGQLAELQDGSGNLITQYTYNALGQCLHECVHRRSEPDLRI